MANLVGPYDTAAWSQAQWYRFSPFWAASGVVGSTPASSVSTGSFGATSSGLNVTIATGRSWIRGGGFEPDVATVKTVTANANATLSRRDRIVIRRNLTSSTTTIEHLAGTAASTPTAPALTQSETGIWEEPICSFLVPPASGTTLSGFVDERLWLPSEAGVPMVYTMANRPTVGNYAGRVVRPLDRPSLVFAWDGRIWVQDGIGVPTAELSSAPDGSWVSEQRGIDTVTVNTGGSGGFNVVLPHAYSADPLFVHFGVGEYTSGFMAAVQAPSFHTSTNAHGQAFTVSGFVASSASIKVVYSAVGYNT